MFRTGINPLDMKPVYVATDYREKQLQRALLQYNRPENAPLVREALTKLGREDLIGFGDECLVRPERCAPSAKPRGGKGAVASKNGRSASHGTSHKKPHSNSKHRPVGAPARKKK
jgi:hypothetical protein